MGGTSFSDGLEKDATPPVKQETAEAPAATTPETAPAATEAAPVETAPTTAPVTEQKSNVD